MIQPIGYFKIWRELFTKPIWFNSTPEQKSILITLLAMANFERKEWEWNGQKYKADKGQFVTSSTSIAKNAGKGISRQNVRTALKRFQKLGFLTYQSTKQGLLITINNWHVYQAKENKTNQEINQDLTKTQPRPNQDLTTREEGKKVRREEGNKKQGKTRKEFPDDHPAKILTYELRDKILGNDPKAKVPDQKDIDKWTVHMDRLLRLDERSFDEVQAVIHWCQNDDFWKANILSTKKLREKFTTLKLQMDRQNKPQPGSNGQNRANNIRKMWEEAKKKEEGIYD